MAKRKKEEDDIMQNADFGEEIFASLAEKANEYIPGSGKVLTENDVDANLTKFISSGSVILDTIISNRKDKGGFPVGRVSEIIGFESSGKTLIALHAMRDTQLQGGIPIYYDIEKAMSLAFMKNMGVDITKVSYNKRLVTIEQVLEQMTNDIKLVIDRQMNKKGTRPIITIVLDSLAACSSNDTLEGEIGARQYANIPRILSQEFPKLIDVLDDANVCMIVLNQLREKPNVTYGDKWYAPGGNAMKFYASLRILLRKGAQIKVNKGKPNESTIGFATTATTEKNKVSAPKRKAPFDIYFNRGVDDSSGFLNILLQTGDVRKKTVQTLELLKGNEVISIKSTEWNKAVREHRDFIVERVKEGLIVDLSNPNLDETRENVDDELGSQFDMDRSEIIDD